MNECIDTALLNNKDLQLSKLEETKALIDHQGTKQTLLPSLNGGATHGYNWGQTIDPFTNEFATNRVQYNNFYLNSSLELFSGMQKYYGIKQKELDHKTAIYNKKVEERNLKMKVITAYLQVLMNEELLNITKDHENLTALQLEQQKALVQAQEKTQRSVMEIEAQYAQDKYLIEKAKNELSISVLKLQQLMGVEFDSSFSISKEVLMSQAKEEVQNGNPELELASLKLERQALEIKKTKGGLLPKLSLNGALGSGYSENSTYLSPNGSLLPRPFGEQFRENLYQSVSVSLNVPIFNRNITKFQLQTLQVELQKRQIEQDAIAIEVKQKIALLDLDISNALSQMKASEIAFEYAKLNYEKALLEYNAGTLNFLELSRIKNDLLRKESEKVNNGYNIKLKQELKTVYFN